LDFLEVSLLKYRLLFQAKLFYMAVVGVGCYPFIEAQKVACECVPERQPKTEL
jgi:hypothetical protein